MIDKPKQPFGRWPSKITPGIFAHLIKISEPAWGMDGSLYWRERSSSQTELKVHLSESGEIQTVGHGLNVGGELLYGGGGYTAAATPLIAVDKTSHQLHQIRPENSKISRLTSSLHNAASPAQSPDGKHVIFVHSDGEVDAINILELSGSNNVHELVSGSDFYSYPRWHPSGSRIAWISWDHPHMPWDSSQLWLAGLDFHSGAAPELQTKQLIAGGDGISIQQPEFSPDGLFLAYCSDMDGWWQIYLFDLDTGTHQQITRTQAEHGLPSWLQDQQSYAFSPDSSRLYYLPNQDGIRSLWKYDLALEKESRIELDENYTWLEDISVSHRGDQIALIASSASLPPRLIIADLDGKTKIIRSSAPHHLTEKFFSVPESISWPSLDGKTVHGLFYNPQNPDTRAEGKPPLLMIIHSGPTRQKWVDFQPRTQYFTSRGYAVLEVNYRGSTGYGRRYWEALAGNWGVTDVDDCLSGALHVTELGWADRGKMVVMGSSSGGMTVYQILVKYPGVFQAGISLSGIANHITLLQDPPKFERYYSEWLIGPYPEAAELYRQRSPVFMADQIRDPVAIFQGGKDRIVPQDQAEQIITALQKNQVPYLYRLYPEEGHSFKLTSTLEDFYSQLGSFLETHLGQ